MICFFRSWEVYNQQVWSIAYLRGRRSTKAGENFLFLAVHALLLIPSHILSLMKLIFCNRKSLVVWSSGSHPYRDRIPLGDLLRSPRTICELKIYCFVHTFVYHFGRQENTHELKEKRFNWILSSTWGLHLLLLHQIVNMTRGIAHNASGVLFMDKTSGSLYFDTMTFRNGMQLTC